MRMGPQRARDRATSGATARAALEALHGLAGPGRIRSMAGSTVSLRGDFRG